ncbi:hypothetical protein D9613_005600 [Agrocybe pediades]|uniref:Uncharacterized protein n=1 Tax=Agrocybe pediades TaxID=84607 RepID=A0A8H4VQJ8_9AGAR|nr:hypothetical protein D9613_005600 [Agrocybe pediades]KAF9550325.1 hypothetical protein CPC08DRAFT_768914 [Agrocybe pediades]
MSSSNEAPDGASPTSGSFFSKILQPGSSLHPTFLLLVDCAFALLFVVFIIMAFLTSGNFHVFALMFIEACLWASVKWFVNELKNIHASQVEENGSWGKEAEQNESKKTI